MRRKSSALSLFGQAVSASVQLVQKHVGVVALLGAFFFGLGLGVIYAYRHPILIEIEGNCNVNLPEFLTPSTT